MLYRVLAAVALAISLAAVPASAQSGSAKAHIAAAKKAERAKNFQKMLDEYTAACSQEPTGECQLGIADALARLGQADKARASYQTLINDPFAQDKWVAKAKKSLSKLDSAPPPSLDLPAGPPSLDGPPPGLDLPAVADAPKKKKGKKDDAPPALDLPPVGDLPMLPADTATSKKKKKKDTAVAMADAPPPSLDGPPPGLDLPAGPPSLDAPPPALDLPPVADAPKKKGKKGKKDTAVAKTDAPPSLDAPPPSLDAPPPLDLPGPPAVEAKNDAPPELPADAPPATPPADEPPAIAADAPPAVPADEPKVPEKVAEKKPVKEKLVAVAAPPSKTGQTGVAANTPKTVNRDALVAPVPTSETPAPAQSGSKARILAYVTTGIAVAALGGGALAYSKASSSASDLHSGVRDGAAQQRLIDQQKLNRSLSAVGLLGGVVAGGVAAILFTF
jgi:hypothetical protein